MKILRTASLESNFIGSYKKKCIQCNKIECFTTSCFAASNNWSSLKLNIYSNDMQWKIGDHGHNQHELSKFLTQALALENISSVNRIYTSGK